MSTAALFIPLFFSQLLEHGQVDKAVAVARQALIQAGAIDWWVPVLYLRLLAVCSGSIPVLPARKILRAGQES
jgi:hypothetical protein